jgi:hypothetical protein
MASMRSEIAAPDKARTRHQVGGTISPRTPSPEANRAIPATSQSNPPALAIKVRSTPSDDSSQDCPKLAGHQLSQAGFWRPPTGLKLPEDWAVTIKPWTMRRTAIKIFSIFSPFESHALVIEPCEQLLVNVTGCFSAQPRCRAGTE